MPTLSAWAVDLLVAVIECPAWTVAAFADATFGAWSRAHHAPRFNRSRMAVAASYTVPYRAASEYPTGGISAASASR